MWRFAIRGPTPTTPEPIAVDAATVCAVYALAPTQKALGIHVLITDEMIGIQALEHATLTLPMQPGKVERRKFADVRHGTPRLIANYQVATGHGVASSIGPTRTEEDFTAHIAQVMAIDPAAGDVFLVDNLNSHLSFEPIEPVPLFTGSDQAEFHIPNRYLSLLGVGDVVAEEQSAACTPPIDDISSDSSDETMSFDNNASLGVAIVSPGCGVGTATQQIAHRSRRSGGVYPTTYIATMTN